MATLTRQQQKALHKWFELKSTQARDAGVTVQMAFGKTVALDFTPDMMKEVWRTVQKALYGKQSTRDLEKVGEIEELVEHLNRFFADNFHLEGIALPSNEIGYWESAPLKENA